MQTTPLLFVAVALYAMIPAASAFDSSSLACALNIFRAKAHALPIGYVSTDNDELISYVNQLVSKNQISSLPKGANNTRKLPISFLCSTGIPLDGSGEGYAIKQATMQPHIDPIASDPTLTGIAGFVGRSSTGWCYAVLEFYYGGVPINNPTQCRSTYNETLTPAPPIVPTPSYGDSSYCSPA